MTSPLLSFPCWYVLHTHGLQESRAEKNLNMWGVETFNPRLRERRRDSPSAKPVYLIKSLFPSYIFARFDAQLMMQKIGFTRGVRKVVSFNGSPVPIAEEIIDLIKTRVEDDGFVKTGQDFKSGDRVVVVKGPLADLMGVFEKDLNDSERVVILLTTVNYQSRMVIERALIRKVS